MSTDRTGQALSDEEEKKQKRELLLKVYSTAIDEYRFNVNLGWDQTKFYVTTATAAIAAGVGLLRLALDSMLLSAFMMVYFALPAYIALLGAQTTNIRKRYVREANLKKTLVELELGLFEDAMPEIPGLNLSISVIPGQRDATKVIVRSRENLDDPVRRGSVVYFTRLLFYGLVGIGIVGSLLAFCNLNYLYDQAVHPPRR